MLLDCIGCECVLRRRWHDARATQRTGFHLCVQLGSPSPMPSLARLSGRMIFLVSSQSMIIFDIDAFMRPSIFGMAINPLLAKSGVQKKPANNHEKSICVRKWIED